MPCEILVQCGAIYWCGAVRYIGAVRCEILVQCGAVCSCGAARMSNASKAGRREGARGFGCLVGSLGHDDARGVGCEHDVAGHEANGVKLLLEVAVSGGRNISRSVATISRSNGWRNSQSAQHSVPPSVQ